ncbi:MAG: hypothetical protein K8S94_02785 [Planctomycetia bacterium]|nr:hypothetical protein [Planctomycetia bacterium]
MAPFPIGLLIVEAAFLAMAHVAGGPPWTVVAGLAFAVLVLAGRPRSPGWYEPVWLILPSLCWLAAFWLTGNRELFFPYTMYLAAHAALSASSRGLFPACVAGGLVVATFLVIRSLQSATPRVLAIEAVAAGVILAATCIALVRRSRSLRDDGLILTAASVAALMSLRLPN